MARRDNLRGAPERRSVSVPFEVRSAADTLKLDGYASVFDADYEVMGGPPWGWIERVDKGAFAETLKRGPDVHLLVNHEGLPLARTRSGTLKLSTDDHGLRVLAELDRTDPDVQRIEPKMRRGDLDEMSFAFRVIRDEWNGDEQSDRTLMEVSLDKGDVSVVNFGANPATSVELTRALAALVEANEDELAELRAETMDASRLIAAQQRIGRVLRAKIGSSVKTLSTADAIALSR